MPFTAIKAVFAAAILASGVLAAPLSSQQLAPRDAPMTQWYQEMVVMHHNIHRSNHSAPKVAWSDGLATAAQDVASSCYFAHNLSAPYDGSSNNYGQNIQAGTGPTEPGVVITGSFYNPEEPKYQPYYGDANPPSGVFDEVGHFTQVVWKNTKLVGCYTQSCPNGVGPSYSGLRFFTVCNYSPPGNYGGQYGTEVGRPLGHPSISGTYTGNIGPDPN